MYWLFNETVTLVGGLLVLAGGYFKYIHPWLKKRKEERKKHKDDLAKAIKVINFEFEPNGGTSLRDSINRIEKEVVTTGSITKEFLNLDKQAVFQTDENGHCVFVNAAYQELVDRQMPELLGRGWGVIIPPEDRELLMGEWESALDGQRVFEMSITYLLPDGTRVPVHVKANPLRDKNGEFLGYFGVTTPV